MYKVYTAARYTRNAEMRAVRDRLEDSGFIVTARWIDLHPDESETPQLEFSVAPEILNNNPDLVCRYAIHDLEDIDNADTLISFTSENGGGKGGRHVEFGYALGRRKRLVIIGPRENIFHTHPSVTRLDNLNDFLTQCNP